MILPLWSRIFEDPEACYLRKTLQKNLSTAYFDYSWQWAGLWKSKEAGLTALLGSGFDGVISVFLSMLKHYFDETTISTFFTKWRWPRLSIYDQLNPEINLREVSAPGSTGKMEKWVKSKLPIKREYDFVDKRHGLLPPWRIESSKTSWVNAFVSFYDFGQFDAHECLECLP